jgi:hypothetical protein
LDYGGGTEKEKEKEEKKMTKEKREKKKKGPKGFLDEMVRRRPRRTSSPTRPIASTALFLITAQLIHQLQGCYVAWLPCGAALQLPYPPRCRQGQKRLEHLGQIAREVTAVSMTSQRACATQFRLKP